MRRKLLKDVSADELMTMRGEGMTNQEIADALSVSYKTVLLLIGPQPKELRKKPEFKTERRPQQTFRNGQSVSPQACLVVANKVVELAGVFGNYTIPIHDRVVNISIGDNSITVPFDKLNDFVKELQAIGRKTEELIFSNEMW